MIKRHGRVLWIAALMAFELLALAYFVRHAPSSNNNAAQTAALRRRQSPANMRRCLSEQHRDARFVQRGACVTHAQRVAAIEDLLFELKLVFNTLEIDFWLDRGTLLGQHRTGGVIPWDVNGDIGVFNSGLDKLRAMRVALPDHYELNAADSAVYPRGDCSDALAARFVDRTHGFYVNIVAFKDTPNATDNGTMQLGTAPSHAYDRCVHCETVDTTHARLKRFAVPRDWILPLRSCSFATFELSCPAQPPMYLMHLYGGAFQEPEVWYE